MNIPCTCDSNQNVSECCVSILNGNRDPETALELMRSRYVAFTLADIDYLMRSHHSKTRPVKEKKSIQKWAKSVKWMGLTILKTIDGKTNDDTGIVEFRALFMENGEINSIHEVSMFERENGSWVYVSGIHK